LAVEEAKAALAMSSSEREAYLLEEVLWERLQKEVNPPGVDQQELPRGQQEGPSIA
jgi:hypothetical protein